MINQILGVPRYRIFRDISRTIQGHPFPVLETDQPETPVPAEMGPAALGASTWETQLVAPHFPSSSTFPDPNSVDFFHPKTCKKIMKPTKTLYRSCLRSSFVFLHPPRTQIWEMQPALASNLWLPKLLGNTCISFQQQIRENCLLWWFHRHIPSGNFHCESTFLTQFSSYVGDHPKNIVTHSHNV